MEYDKSALDAYVESFLLDRDKFTEKQDGHERTSRPFENIPMVMKTIAAKAYFMSIHMESKEMEWALASYLNSKFPDSIDPEIAAAIEYARQYWIMAYGY